MRAAPPRGEGIVPRASRSVARTARRPRAHTPRSVAPPRDDPTEPRAPRPVAPPRLPHARTSRPVAPRQRPRARTPPRRPRAGTPRQALAQASGWLPRSRQAPQHRVVFVVELGRHALADQLREAIVRDHRAERVHAPRARVHDLVRLSA